MGRDRQVREAPNEVYHLEWFQKTWFIMVVCLFAFAGFFLSIVAIILVSVHSTTNLTKLSVKHNATVNEALLTNLVANVHGNSSVLQYNGTAWNVHAQSIQAEEIELQGTKLIAHPPNKNSLYKTLQHTDFVSIALPNGSMETGQISVPMGKVFESGSTMLTKSASGFFGLVVSNTVQDTDATMNVFIATRGNFQAACSLQKSSSTAPMSGTAVGTGMIVLANVVDILSVGTLYTVACKFTSTQPWVGETAQLLVTMNLGLQIF